MHILVGGVRAVATGGYHVAVPDPADIAVARLSNTSVRITFSGSDSGSENYAVYSTETNAGDTWTAAGNRTGDGTLDVSGLAAGTTYYFASYSRLGGVSSVFSNIVLFTMTYSSASTPLLHMGYPKLLKQRKFMERDRDSIFYQYMYELGVKQTLEQAGLDYGDSLPEDSTATIVKAKLSKSPGKANNMATVVARFANEWAD